MATPPELVPGAAPAAVASIYARHRDRGAARIEEMPTAPGEMLDYLREHATLWPAGLRVDDLDDVTTLLVWRWWEARREERFWLDQVVKLGVSRKGFAAGFNVTSSQGFRDWRDRLHALLDETGPGRPDEQVMRADRAAARNTSEPAFVRDHLGEYEALAAAVVALYMDVDEDTAAYVLEVRRDLNSGQYGPEHVPVLQLAMEALQDCPVPRLADRIAAVVDRWASLQERRRTAEHRVSAVLGDVDRDKMMGR